MLLNEKLAFPSQLVASSNAPWIQAGHIAIGSGYGPWPDSLRLFAQLQARVAA